VNSKAVRENVVNIHCRASFRNNQMPFNRGVIIELEMIGEFLTKK
jgi:hypothetical protein